MDQADQTTSRLPDEIDSADQSTLHLPGKSDPAAEAISRLPGETDPTDQATVLLPGRIDLADQTTSLLPDKMEQFPLPVTPLPARTVPWLFRQRRPGPLALASILFSVLLIIGSITVFLFQQASLSAHASSHGCVVAYAGPSPTPTPAISPTPQPLQSLPKTLQAQIPYLQEHKRFFYNGNTNLPEIALTFDDGPNPANTPQVLAVLRKYHIHATFFDLGRLVKVYPDLARQELADGNIVGNHTWSHPDLPTLSTSSIKKQIRDSSDAIEQATGVRPIFLRPPYGDLSANVLKIVNSFGKTTVIWNNDSRDWSIPGTSAIISRVLASVGNGTIILLHDGGGNRQQTIAALPTIIQHLQARHYQFVTLAQLAAHARGTDATPTPTPTATPTPSIAPGQSICVAGKA